MSWRSLNDKRLLGGWNPYCLRQSSSILQAVLLTDASAGNNCGEKDSSSAALSEWETASTLQFV
jgi:hypothetical protein